MIERALHKYGIDPNQSVMFGDKQRDIDAAEKAGVRGMIVEINKGVPLFQSFDFIN